MHPQWIDPRGGRPMRRPGLGTTLACIVLLMVSTGCGSDPDPYDRSGSTTRSRPTSNPTRVPEPPPVETAGAATPRPAQPPPLPQQLVGFWYRETVLGGGVKGTRSLTLHPSAQFEFQESLCTQSKCDVKGQGTGWVFVNGNTITFQETGGSTSQTRFPVQSEYGTGAVQLWLH